MLRNALLAFALAFVCAFYVPPDDGPRTPTSDPTDLCSITYESPWDGTPQKPIYCP
jgi:hypothetical protein